VKEITKGACAEQNQSPQQSRKRVLNNFPQGWAKPVIENEKGKKDLKVSLRQHFSSVAVL
jgi:hypothetical protein